MPSMSTFLCKNGVRKEYFLTPTFIIEPLKRFYNLFWGAKVTVQMRVLSAPTFFNKKIGICTQILYN